MKSTPLTIVDWSSISTRIGMAWLLRMQPKRMLMRN
jgi:hypothetical protein